MRSIRLLVLLTAAFVAGIAFVLACGNGGDDDDGILPIDAARTVDAAECGEDCEPAITPGRIYRATDTTTRVVEDATPPATLLLSEADCDGGILLGGGCVLHTTGAISPFEQNAGARITLISHGPTPESFGGLGFHGYVCAYGNPEGLDGVVVAATAICFMPETPQ